MRFKTIEEIAAKWDITPRQVRTYCASGRIPGAKLEHGEWRIPDGALKPERKSRRTFPTSILGVLEAERSSRISGGLYHRLQIDLAYNSNHIEGSRQKITGHHHCHPNTDNLGIACRLLHYVVDSLLHTRTSFKS